MYNKREERIEQIIADLSLSDKNVVVLVEDKEDMAFWKRVISEFAPTLVPDFPMFIKSKEQLQETGKGELSKYVSFVSDKVIICADSDNDAYHKTSDTIWLSPRKKFIYQTYLHSRENHCINHQHLNLICLQHAHEHYDFKQDFENISKALYEYLILWLFFTDTENKKLRLDSSIDLNISWKRLKSIVAELNIMSLENKQELQSIHISLHEKILDIKRSIEEQIKENNYGYILRELDEFKRECPILPEETLYFIQGHCAFESIIVPFLDKMIALLKNTKIKSYEDVLLNSYTNCFSKNSDCKFFKKIEVDFRADFE